MARRVRAGTVPHLGVTLQVAVIPCTLTPTAHAEMSRDLCCKRNWEIVVAFHPK